MIKKILCFCLITAAACGGNDDVPDEVLSPDKMTGILVDVYVTEAQVDNHIPRLPRDSALYVFDVLKSDIMEEHNVTDSVFRKSMRWYFQHPEKLDIIYSRVIDSLNLKVQQNRAPEEQPL